MTVREALRVLAPALRVRRWALPTVIVLGVLSSLAEGIGIGLFAPLLSALLPGAEADAPPRLVSWLDRPFAGLPADRRIQAMALAIFVAILARALLSYLHRATFDWMDAEAGHALRQRVFARLMGMGLSRVERDRSGHLLSVLATDTWRATEALKVTVHLAITTATVVIYGTLLMLLSWRLTLVVAVVSVLVSFVLRGLARRTALMGQTISTANADLAERMSQSIDGMRIIRAFGREDHESERFRNASDRVRTALARSGFLEGVVAPVFEVMAAALILGGLAFAAGSGTRVSSALVFLFILYRLQPRLRDLDQGRVRLATLGASVTEVARILQAETDERPRPGTRPPPPLADAITFDGVTFRYPGEAQDALRSVDFRIDAGATVAFAGPSGGGKSTVLKLLLRFHDPTDGSVQVDGIPLRELDLAAWRGRIALVSQDVMIFNASVRENIAYGRAEASADALWDAAERAHAADFIRGLPDGLDTVLGHRGSRLSGGQQQRITLARALLRDPAILILDEATNALDSISEDIVRRTLEERRPNRTVIVVAHRMSTVERADHVIVLEDGCVREQGPPSPLLRSGGLLERMARLQGLEMG